jgi:hypothetical protein
MSYLILGKEDLNQMNIKKIIVNFSQISFVPTKIKLNPPLKHVTMNKLKKKNTRVFSQKK